MDKERYQRGLANAHNNFIGLCYNQSLVDEFARLEEGMEMPVDPPDVLDYLGAMGSLKLTDEHKDDARRTVSRLLRDHSPEWVWQSRTRLKLEIDFAVNVW
jgi:hypothetical protein